MKKTILVILLSVSLPAMSESNGVTYYYSTYGDHSNYTGRYVEPPQPMYYNQERLQEQRELDALKESNDIAREQLQLER